MKNRNRKGKRAQQEILSLGEAVLFSDVFESALHQVHHHALSVADHTLNVALTSMDICYFLDRLHVKADKRDVVIGALAHDLGILGRYEKYRNNLECCRRHPVDSVRIARDLIPDLNEKTEQIIRRHMWPLSLRPPCSREGMIVMAADKYSSIREVLGRMYPAAGTYKKEDRAELIRAVIGEKESRHPGKTCRAAGK